MRPKTRWIDSSPQASRTPQLREDMTDDLYNMNMQIREPAFRWILNNLPIDPNKPWEYLNCPVTVIGVRQAPFATELSQWEYPVTLLLQDLREKRFADKNAETHNGKFKTKIGKYYNGLRRSRVIVWIDDDNKLPRDRVGEWVKHLHNNSQILIMALRKSRENLKLIQSMRNCKINTMLGKFYFVIAYH